MAKATKAPEAPTSPDAPQPDLVRCKIVLREDDYYLGQMRDGRRNIVRSYLFYDGELLDKEVVRLLRARKADVIAKPGEVIEIPKADFLVMERAGAVREVK